MLDIVLDEVAGDTGGIRSGVGYMKVEVEVSGVLLKTKTLESVVLTNIAKLDSLGIWCPGQSLHDSLGSLDVACVVEGDQGARLVLKKRLDIEAQECSRRIRLNVVGAINESSIEFNRVVGFGD